MPIYETLDPSDPRILEALFYDADLIAVGEAFARLASFFESDTEQDIVRCDGGTVASFRVAACKLVGLDRDKTTDHTQVKRTDNGTSVWKRLKKNENAPKNAETRTVSVRSYSADAKRAGVKTLRESHGVAIQRAATLTDGSILLRLARNTDSATADIDTPTQDN